MSDMVTGKDADFSEERLITRYNSELANSLGNLMNRTLNMAQRYCGGALRREPGSADFANAVKLLSPADRAMAMTHPSVVLEAALGIAASCNNLIEQEKPWVLAKDQESQKRLQAVLFHLADSLRIIAILISPVLPKAAHGIFDQLNWKMDLSRKEERFSLGEAEWGRLPDGHLVGKPTPLFPRIEAALADN
jgi:methionyl-tRNA synthetase